MEKKYYINEKTHLATEKILHFIIPWKLINGGGILISSGGSVKNCKINKRSRPVY